MSARWLQNYSLISYNKYIRKKNIVRCHLKISARILSASNRQKIKNIQPVLGKTIFFQKKIVNLLVDNYPKIKCFRDERRHLRLTCQ